MNLPNPTQATRFPGRVTLVTGAGGSIGSELCRQVAAMGPSRLVLLDIDETEIFLLADEISWLFPEVPTTCIVGDVRDNSRIGRIFETLRPDVVIHAAAYKHVPMMEDNAWEAVGNNVRGTMCVASEAGRHGAAAFVNLSTDKAFRPCSIMGATKRVAELAVRICADEYPDTSYSSVRFGNVRDSRGSVIPTFRRQIERRVPLTVTHPEATRYFIDIPDAARLVLVAATTGAHGDIFTLDMGEPVRIADLASEMIRESGLNLEIVYTGLRPGEKLTEENPIEENDCIFTGIPGLYVNRARLIDAGAFKSGLNALLRLPASSEAHEIRCILASMDIGLQQGFCQSNGE